MQMWLQTVDRNRPLQLRQHLNIHARTQIGLLETVLMEPNENHLQALKVHLHLRIEMSEVRINSTLLDFPNSTISTISEASVRHKTYKTNKKLHFDYSRSNTTNMWLAQIFQHSLEKHVFFFLSNCLHL